MAITIGNASSSGNINNVNTTYSWQHITHADTDCLVVCVSGNDGTAGDRDITGVTYNAVALTNAEAVNDGTSQQGEVWYITETAYGANLGGVTANVVVTHGGKCTDGCGHAIDLIGVDQAAPEQDSNTATGANSDPTVTVAGAVAGSMTVGVCTITEADPSQLSVGAGTEFGETDMGGNISSAAYRSGNGTLTWAHTTDDEAWCVAAADFSEAAGAVTGAAALSGNGALSAVGLQEALGAAALSGTGNASAAGLLEALGAAALSGTGALSAVGTLGAEVTGAAALSGTGALTAAGQHTAIGAAALSGTGALSAAGLQIAGGIAALSGTGSLTGAGLLEAFGAAALTGTGSLSAVPAGAAIMGVAALSGTGALSAAGLQITSGAVVLSGTGALTAAGLQIAPGAVTLTGAGALSAAGLQVAPGVALLTGAGALSAVGTLPGAFVGGAAALSGTGALSVIASVLVIAGSGRTYYAKNEQAAHQAYSPGRTYYAKNERAAHRAYSPGRTHYAKMDRTMEK